MIREVKVEVIPLKHRLIAGTGMILISLACFMGNALTPLDLVFWSPMRIWASILFSIGLIFYFGKFLEVNTKLGPHPLKVVKRPATVTYIALVPLVIISSIYSFYIF